MPEFTTESNLEYLAHINLAVAEKLGAMAVRQRYALRSSHSENEPLGKSNYAKAWERIDLGLSDDPDERAGHFAAASDILREVAADREYAAPVIAMRADMTLAVLPLFEWRAVGEVPPPDVIAASRDALAAQIGGILDDTGGDPTLLDQALRGHFSELLTLVMAMHDEDPANLLHLASPIEEHAQVAHGDLNFNHDAYRLMPDMGKRSVQVKTGGYKQILRPKEGNHEYHPVIMPLSVTHLALYATGVTSKRVTPEERWNAYIGMSQALATPFPTAEHTKVIRRGVAYLNNLFESYFAPPDPLESLLRSVATGTFAADKLAEQMQAARRAMHDPENPIEVQYFLRTIAACEPAFTALANREPLQSPQRQVMRKELAHMLMQDAPNITAISQILLLLVALRKDQPYIVVPKLAVQGQSSSKFCALYAPDGRGRHLKVEPGGSKKTRYVPILKKAVQASGGTQGDSLSRCKWFLVQEALGRPVTAKGRDVLNSFVSGVQQELTEEWRVLCEPAATTDYPEAL